MNKILIIDDEKVIHESLKLILSDLACEIDSVYTPTEALTKIQTSQYQLIICDYNLGNTKGTDLILKAQKDGFKGKIVMMSGNPEIKDRFKIFQKDVLAMFEKPFKDIFEFKKTIDLFLEIKTP